MQKESLLTLLSNDEQWALFAQHKSLLLSQREQQQLDDFVANRRYLFYAQKILANNYEFSVPVKRMISKRATAKKRTVYLFAPDEVFILKFISYQLSQHYDYVHAPNLYSFRANYGVKSALSTLCRLSGGLWCYKLDVSNYFNSINVDKLLPMLKSIFEADNALYSLLHRLLTADKAVWKGSVICEKRGAMAGMPLSPFLANVYLSSLDNYFYSLQVPYARYADDVILFAPTEQTLNDYKQRIANMLGALQLEVNFKKQATLPPYTPWTFLGIEYGRGQVDLSPVTLAKMKASIRRKARAILRWKVRRNVPAATAVKVMINKFNGKLFFARGNRELTWSRWFFPLLTTTSRLKQVDAHLQRYLRFVYCGDHSKKGYKLSYADMKQLGYLSLVNAYYRTKTNRNK